MDRPYSYDLIRLYLENMDRTVEQISLEHRIACFRQMPSFMQRLAQWLMRLGRHLQENSRTETSGCYIPQKIYRDR